jgi:hypothetical protein
MPELEMPRPRARRRGLGRPIAIVLAVVLLPVLAFVVWDRTEDARLRRAVASVDLSDDAGSPLPRTDEQVRASHAYGEAERLSESFAGAATIEPARFIEELQVVSPGDVAHDPRYARLQEIEKPYDRALELLDRASALDARGFADEDRPPLYGVSAIARVNAIRTARLSLAGNGERASASLLATLRLSRVSTSPLRSAQNLELILNRAVPAEPTLAALQREYARVESQETVQARLEAARFRLLQMMLPEEFGNPPWMTSDRRVSPLETIVTRLVRPSRVHGLVRQLADFERGFAVAARPWPEKLDAARPLMEEGRIVIGDRRRRSLLQALTAPVPPGFALNELGVAVTTVAEALARDRVAITALAIARYRRAHGGAPPAALRDLVPAYLSAVPLDPYTGAELHYTRDPTAYRVYSAGANRKDDGGTWYVMSDLNWARRGDPNDIGLLVKIG